MRLYTGLQGIRNFTFQPQSAHLEVKASSGQSQDSRRLGDVPASAIERRNDQLALHGFDGCCEVAGGEVGPRDRRRHVPMGLSAFRSCKVGRQMFGLDRAAWWAHRDGPLNLVSQLA